MKDATELIRKTITTNIHPCWLKSCVIENSNQQLPVYLNDDNPQYIKCVYMDEFRNKPSELLPIIENHKELNLQWINIFVTYASNINNRYSITKFTSKEDNQVKYAVIYDYFYDNEPSSEDSIMTDFSYHIFDDIIELLNFITNNVVYNKQFIRFAIDLSCDLGFDFSFKPKEDEHLGLDYKVDYDTFFNQALYNRLKWFLRYMNIYKI